MVKIGATHEGEKEEHANHDRENAACADSCVNWSVNTEGHLVNVRPTAVGRAVAFAFERSANDGDASLVVESR